jgi:pyranose oxidase
MAPADDTARGGDVLIVGSGPVAATFARLLAGAGRRVLLLEAGPALDPAPGGHLLASHLLRADPDLLFRAVAARLLPASSPVVAEPPRRLGPEAHAAPEEGAPAGFNPAQEPRRNLPAAALCPAVGGMGTVWTCLAPRPHPALERWDGIPAAEWEELLAAAEALLQVGRDRLDASMRQRAILDRLRAHYAGALQAPPGPAPLAAAPGDAAGGRALRWTSPADLLAAVASTGRVEIRAEHVVRRLLHRGGRVVAAEVVDLAAGRELRLGADLFVVAGGAVQTPQLLWASGIQRDEGSALGRYLTDHPLGFGRLVLGRELVAAIAAAAGMEGAPVPVPADDPPAFLWVPLQEGRPFHAFLLQDKMDLRSLEGRIDRRLLLNLYWYALAAPRRDNRVRFADGTRDLFGLPRPVFDYALADEERQRALAMLDDLRAAGERLGAFLPLAPPQLLAAGSSMHLAGTTRMGTADDGDSVVDPWGKVWGCDNLYLGGTGLLPVATAVNPTLTAVALAVRAARRLILEPLPAAE